MDSSSNDIERLEMENAMLKQKISLQSQKIQLINNENEMLSKLVEKNKDSHSSTNHSDDTCPDKSETIAMQSVKITPAKFSCKNKLHFQSVQAIEKPIEGVFKDLQGMIFFIFDSKFDFYR